MAATASAPRTARRAARKPASAAARPARKPAAAAARPARSRRGITPPAGFAIPAAAVGRTAVAVGHVADSGLVVRLTRSRLWIGLLAGLLTGIVGLNVYALSLNASASKVAQSAERLARENSTLRAQLTERLSNERVQVAAAELGLALPEPDAIRYLRSQDGDAETAAKRLLDGELAPAGAVLAATRAPLPEPAPAATAPVEPAPAEAAPVAPVDPAATTEPTTPPPGTVP
jgi:hypothetical protein